MSEIGKAHNVDRTTIGKYFNKYGLKTKSPSDSHRKYKLNEHFFDVIDSEEKAYWLGFLYADGNVGKNNNTINLELNVKDKKHLIAFKKAISAENPLSNSITQYLDYNPSESVAISVSSQIMKNALINKGCLPNKTFILKYPSYDIVPNNLQRHFIRGIFDGDGCIQYYLYHDIYYKITFNIVGTNDIVSGIANELLKNKVVEYLPKVYAVKKIYGINIYGKYNAIRIMHYLYDNATVFLDRKYQKFLDITELNSNDKYSRRIIDEKVCFVCGDKNSIRYITWHKDDEYYNKILCNKHYEQLTKAGKIMDFVPYTKPQIYCINNNMVFDTKRDAANWCGMKSSFGITQCINGIYKTSGKDP